MKQAYLICTHGSFNLLKRLIKQLDDKDTDIFIHIDKKAGNINYADFENITKKSSVICLRNRVSVIWGHITQPLTSIMMLEAALKHGNYDYLHLISGVDFPIKSNAYIKNFLEKNQGCEFIGLKPTEKTEFEYKLGLYHLIPANWSRKNSIFEYLDKILLKGQKILRIRHYHDTSDFAKGCNWWSITGTLAQDIVQNKAKIAKTYQYTSCSDEIFIQTFICQNQDKYKLYDRNDEYRGCLRKIDWQRGNPYVWQTDDIDELLSSNALFARKFSEENMNIIGEIEKKIL